MNKAIIQKAAMPLTEATDIDVPFSHLPIKYVYFTLLNKRCYATAQGNVLRGNVNWSGAA